MGVTAGDHKTRILAVDDEKDLLELLQFNLTREGYQVSCAADGESALREARSGQAPDLILLDLMLPGMNGLEVCKILKNDPQTQKIPIVMLTAKGEEADIVVGLEFGADDYVTKPFSPRILLARIRSALRRSRSLTEDQDSQIQLSGLSINLDRHEALIHGRRADLTATEFRILALLARKPGRVFTRAQIVDAARGEDYPVTDRSVDVHIVSLRKKMGQLASTIETVRGVGYRMIEA